MKTLALDRASSSLSLILFLIVSFCNVPATLAQQSPVVADNAELMLISDQFSFTEGPAADKDGNVYFTDQPNNEIWRYSTDDSLSLFMEDAGRSNGLYFDHDGNLLAAADEESELWSISINPEKEINVFLKDFEGRRLNGPNDLWVDPKGGIYFTDPYYQREYWERTEKEIEQERVYYITPGNKDVVIVADDLVKPNGIIGTPDGKRLYVADIGDKKTYSYSINADGQLSDKKLFTEMGSDGMTLDSEGNLYLTGDGVIVFNKNGKKIEHIKVPREWTANVTFGGPKHQTLFITASTALYKIPMKVQGVR